MSLPDDTNTAMEQFPGEPLEDSGPPTIGLDDSGAAGFGSPPAVPTGPPPAPAPAPPGNRFRPPPVPGPAPGTLPFASPTAPAAAPPQAPAAPTLHATADDSMPGVAEFELSGLDSPSLQADLAPGDIDLPQPVTRDSVGLPVPVTTPPPPPIGLDLPAPVTGAPPAPFPGLDLPAPVTGAPAAPVHPPSAFEPPGTGPIDLPAPVELDLPAPVSHGVPPAAPLSANPVGPAPHGYGPGTPDLPVPVDLDLPAPAELNLPTPVQTDLMQPAGMDVRPAGMDMQPAAMDLEPAALGLEPAALDMEPASTGLQPVELDLVEPAHTELRPADLDLQSAEQGLAPVDARGVPLPASGPVAAAAAAAASVGTPGAIPSPSRTPSPAHKSNAGGGGPSRGLMIGLGGVLVLGLVGGGVMYSGILDPIDDPQPSSLNGNGKPSKPVPDGPAIDRSADALAKMALDTPTGYREAIASAEQAADAAGAAEAALLLHFRYGPNIEVAGNGAKLIEPYAAQKDAFVQRVLGLAAIAGGQLDKAEAALVGDDPRTRLYRGWLRIAQDRPADALTEAAAVLTATPDDTAAQVLELAATTATDPAAALTQANIALKSNPGHPGLIEQVIAAGLASGNVAAADTALASLTVDETEGSGYKARVQAWRGNVARASGRYAEAAEQYAKALELQPDNLPVSMDRARTLVAAQKFVDAERVTAGLLRTHGKSADVQLLAAEVAIAGGETDRALEALTTAQKALPKDPRVADLLGQIHALKLEVEQAQKMYAAAREHDATYVDASIHEAQLLANIKRLDDATALLDTAKTAADTDKRTEDAAKLLVAKASLLTAANKRNAAIAALTEALTLVPSDNAAQVQRGIQRIATGEAAEGEADLNAVFERTGGYPGLARPLGYVYLRDNRVDDLETLIASDLNGEKTPSDLVLLGARLRLLQGKVADAKTLIGVALGNNPSDWEGHMLLSEAHIQDLDYPAALTAVEKARPLEPQAELYLQKGRVLEFNGRHDEARPLYYKAVSLDPDAHEARFLYGRALEKSGDFAGAIRELTRVVNAEATKTASWYAEAWMHLGIAQGSVSGSSQAIKSLSKATALNDQLGEAWAELGELYGRDNKHGKAIPALAKAVELGPSNVGWYYNALMNLGRAQNKSGKVSQAKATFKRFLDAAPADHSGRSEARRVLGL